MASYDKLVKYLADRFQAAVAPLVQITQNQEIIIAQNKKMIDLLSQINSGRENQNQNTDDSEQSKDVTPEG